MSVRQVELHTLLIISMVKAPRRPPVISVNFESALCLSVSPKCQSARGMQGHSNKIKQEFGLTGFLKVRETIFWSECGDQTTGKSLLHASIRPALSMGGDAIMM